ncbi:hypothetical protein QBC46DRAFT_378003 [Diplogelasinospora grovesii]|uniref:CFEM domain-containing protein n=1 Tax=Diplogelasinospora grovesii TaxID=303347 RepID=A0AAN6NGH3_9PEZI|nr:hypothetical protein QBC46DRAFT_378003 [Diplogelasinospora grovesii]
MKVPAVLLSLAGLASVAVAQAPTLPNCAQGCANQFLGSGIGNCGTNPACICADKDFISGISCCLASACNQADQSSAIDFASRFCGANGVTTLPTTVVCASTAASAAATTTASSESAAATTTASSESASATATGSSSGASATNASASSTAAPGSSSSHNAGPRPTAAAGALGAIGGIVAAVAML